MEPRDLFGALKKRWVLIVVIAVVVVGGVLVFSWDQTPVYEASATCMVSAAVTGVDQYAAVQVIEQLLQTIDKIAVTRPVLIEASTKLNNKVSSNQLENAVSSEVLPNTQIIVIHAKDTKAATAVLEANAVADSLISYFDQQNGNNGSYKIVKVESAVAPTSPISPKPVRNGVIGVFLGLLLGVASALVVESINGWTRSS